MSAGQGLNPVSRSAFSAVTRLGVIVSPAILLSVAALRATDQRLMVGLGLGAAMQVVVAGLIMAYRHHWAPPLDGVVLLSQVAALAWLWFMVPSLGADWYLNTARAMLILLPLGVIAAYAVEQSGALLFRHAHLLSKRISGRTRWPGDPAACRDLPETKAFREALKFDAAPALRLLNDARPEVRICALAALEFRHRWRAGQAETVLYLLQREAVPEVRAVAVSALANIDDRQMLETLANSLRDPDPRVRRATADALFWNSDRRWQWMQFGVRRALSEPVLADDGPLLGEAHKLAPEAVDDLTAWCAEKGVLAIRAAQVLVAHFARVLYEKPDETLATLYRIVADVQAAPVLRIQLAQLLRDHQALNPPMLENLHDCANPAPLRLIGAEVLLATNYHTGAVATLRDIARLPNRDLALSTAEVVQRCLGMDLGLPLGQPLPPLNSPKAIEVTRQLMAWAARTDSLPDVPPASLAPSAAEARHSGLRRQTLSQN